MWSVSTTSQGMGNNLADAAGIAMIVFGMLCCFAVGFILGRESRWRR
jgi:hypothetical protein